MMDKAALIKGGISYDEALLRFVGNEKLYEKYLVKFLDDKHMEDAVKAYKEGKSEELLELVHALKGEAGTLGLMELFAACSAVVADLRNQRLTELEEKMHRIDTAYEKCVGIIREACGK